VQCTNESNLPVRLSRGFTFFELLLVLAIIATTAVVVVPRLGASPRADLEAATRVLAAGFRQGRSQAVTTGEQVVVVLDLDRKQFSLQGGVGVRAPARVRALPRAVAYELFTARSEQRSKSQAGIRFYPDGTSTGGRITATAGQHQRLVDVDWLTGMIRIYTPEAG